MPLKKLPEKVKRSINKVLIKRCINLYFLDLFLDFFAKKSIKNSLKSEYLIIHSSLLKLFSVIKNVFFISFYFKIFFEDFKYLIFNIYLILIFFTQENEQ